MFAAAQIYNMLMDYKGNVTVKIDGLAASAASVIAMAGTKVLKQSLSSVIGQGTKEPSESTGDLREPLSVTKPYQSADGNWNIEVGCIGYDRKGVPNPLKAAVLEHGCSNQPAKSWAKPAGRKAKKECIKKMQEALDSEVEKL